MRGQIMSLSLENKEFFYAAILLIGVLIGSISQVLLKRAAQRQYDSWIKEYFNLRVISAYVLFFGTTLLSVVAYKGIPLSWGPILESTGYLYVTAFGVTIFHEKMNRTKIMSLFLILTGIAIYALLG